MTDVKESVRQQFEAAAGRYRTSAVHAQGEDLAALVQALALTGAESVLDAGCGAGHASLAVAPHAAAVVALDLSDAMLGQVRRLAAERGAANVQTRRGDVEQIPFADGTFDVAISRYSAHHWPNPAAALAGLARVLKPGGRFVLSDIVSPLAPALDTYLQTLELLRDPSHVRDHTIDQWLSMFAEAGFQAGVVYEWRLRLEFLPWLERIGTPQQNAAMIAALLNGAPAEVRAELEWQEYGSFVLRGALIRGIRE